MMNLNQLAEWLGGQRLEGNDTPTMTSVVATATSQSEDGYVKVAIDGDVIGIEDADGNQLGSNEIEIPTSAHVEQGDNVIITLFGGAMSKPLYTQVQGSGDRTYNLAVLAQAAAEAAEVVASEAHDAVEATNQHFFSDSNGIHVSTEENDANTGPNLLANSLGILLRDGTLIRTAQTASGFAVYDGLGNQSGNIIALLGDVITLGKNGEQRLVLDHDAFELLNTGGGEFFHVGYSDNAKGAGGSTVTAPFMLFDSTGTIASRTIGAYSVALGLDVHAQQFGSLAFGLSAIADGTASFAAGDNVVAKNYGEAAFGMYNEIDTSGTKLFSVGNGLTDSNRSDAFSVFEDGTAKLGDSELLAYDVLYINTSGSWTGTITLYKLIRDYTRVDFLYKDTDGVFGSTTVWNPTQSFKVGCSTNNFFNTGFSSKGRTMQVNELSSTTQVFTSGLTNGEFVIDANGSRYQSGNYIGITAIIGYK